LTLRFPNPTRRFDEARKAVHFVGHDGVFEIRFYVEAGALADDAPPTDESVEEKYLSAFDRRRDAIQNGARAAYSHTGLRSYTLSASDLR